MGVVAQGAPVFRIGGDPGGISTRAAVMMDRANEFADIHAGLSSLTSDGWQGRTANHFRYKFNLQIKGWLDAQIAFSDASTAYQSYASTLLSAQSQCDEIRSRWEQGRNAVEQAQNNKADARSRAAAEGGTPMFDASCDEGPGRSTMAAAEDDFQTLVNQVNESATLLINALNSGISKLPERTWMDAATRTLKSVYDGFVEATIDLIKLTWTLGGYAALYDFGRFICGHMTFEELHAKWIELPAETFVGLTTVLSENPEAFFEGLAKGLFDYDTLIDDPGRAFGHAIPDILITIATAGAGTSASAGSKGATRTSKAARIGRAVFKELTHISDIEDIAHLSKLAFRKIKRIGVHAVTSLSDIAENAAERLRHLKEAGHTGHPSLSAAPDNSPHIPSSGTSSASSHGGLSTPAQDSHPAAGNTHTPSHAGPHSGADHGGSHQAGQGSNGHSGASSSHAATNTGGGAPNSEPPIPTPPKSEAPTTHSLSDTAQAPHAGADIADGKPHAADPTTPTHEADGSTDGSTGYKYREKYGSPESDASSHTTNPDGDGDKNPHHNLFNGDESSHSHHSAAGEHADAEPTAKDHSANGKADNATDSTRHGDKTEADKPTSDKSHKEHDAAHHDGDKHPKDTDDKHTTKNDEADTHKSDKDADGKSPKDEADAHKSDKDADGKSDKDEADTHKSNKDADGKSDKDEADTHKSDKDDADGKSDKDSGEHADADPKAKDHSANGKADDAADSTRHGDKTDADKPTSDKSHKEDDAVHHDGDEHPKDPDDKHTTKTDAHKSDKDEAEHADAEPKAKDHSANGKADDAADSARHGDKTEADKPTSDKSHKEHDAAHHDGDEHPKDTDDKHTTKNDDADSKSTKDDADTHKSDKDDTDGKSDEEKDHPESKNDDDGSGTAQDASDSSADAVEEQPQINPESLAVFPEDYPTRNYIDSEPLNMRPIDEVPELLEHPERMEPPTTIEELVERSPRRRPDPKWDNHELKDEGLGKQYKTAADITMDAQGQLSHGTHPEMKSPGDWTRSRYYDPASGDAVWRTDVDHGAVPGTKIAYTDIKALTKDFGIQGLDRTSHVGGSFMAPIIDNVIIPNEFRGTPITSVHEPYRQYDFNVDVLPDGYKAEISIAAPEQGSLGGTPQIQVMERQLDGKWRPMSIAKMLKANIIKGVTEHVGTPQIPNFEAIKKLFDQNK